MRWIGIAAAACLLAAQETAPAPPAVARLSVVNDASHMPAVLAGGSIAQGSLFRIQGWRLGPAEPVKAPPGDPQPSLAGVSVTISSGTAQMSALPVFVSTTEIRAILPLDAPTGPAQLRVSRDGAAARLPSLINIVETSFGAYSVNHRGWGPGEVTNADGRQNSLDHAARPGETVRLMGTGLGKQAPRVMVGAKPAEHEQTVTPPPDRPGVDVIQFQLPRNTPEGCYVPVRVRAGGVVSNTVTLAVSARGGACSNAGNWIAAEERQPGSFGTIVLTRTVLQLITGDTVKAEFPMDSAQATFVARQTQAGVSPLYMFPPPGTCTTLQGTASPRSIGAVFDAASGPVLDAGKHISIRGPLGEKEIGRMAERRRYSALLGGQSPIGSASKLPLFLSPGDYTVSVPGGSEVGQFAAHVKVEGEVDWTNRAALEAVSRNDGVTVRWRPGGKGDLMLVIAMNSIASSSAVGMCSCLERASAGQFSIPAEALANVPAGGESEEGLPLNLLGLAEFPGSPGQPVKAPGVDRVISFFASVVARTVVYR